MVFKYQPTFLATVFLIYSVLLSKVSRQALFSFDKFIKQPEHPTKSVSKLFNYNRKSDITL